MIDPMSRLRPNAIVQRLSHYLPLTADEREALALFEKGERRLAPGHVLLHEGGLSTSLFVVQQGWLHSSLRLVSGARQITRFHYAGDLIGTSSIAWAQASATITAISDCIVSEVPKSELGLLFRTHPRLAGLLYAVASAENVAMGDRLTAVGRRPALERMVMLLLDIFARLRATAGGVVDSIDLPLTQTDIGDAIGTTKVHVNRTLREMERLGMIVRSGRRLRLVDEAALVAMTGFVDRYGEVATDWLVADDTIAA